MRILLLLLVLVCGLSALVRADWGREDDDWVFTANDGSKWTWDDSNTFTRKGPSIDRFAGFDRSADKRDDQQYDVVIAGGGAAACVMARILADKPSRPEVLILEGGDAIDPAFSENLNPNGGHWDQPNEDKYQSTPEEFTGGLITGGRMPHFTAFKGLGGGTNHYGATAMRPTEDYWNTRMPPEFNATRMLVRLKQNEDHYCCYLPESVTGISAANCSAYHGCGGFMPIAMQVRSTHSQAAQDVFAAAAGIVGQIADHNNPKTPVGIAGEQNWYLLANKSDPLSPRVKVGTYQAFLPKSFRNSHPNLVISTRSHVQQLIYSRFDPTRVVGVVFLKNGVLNTVTARDYVVVSMGVMSTPKFLQENGIGPFDLLDRINATKRVNNPHIGQNLSAHQGVLVSFKLNASTIGGGPGAGGSTMVDMLMKTPFTSLSRDIQFTMGAGGYSETIDYDVDGLPLDMVAGVDSAVLAGRFDLIPSRLSYIGFNLQMVDPTPVGSVNATSTDPLLRPVFTHGWTNAGIASNDLNKIMYALNKLRQVMSSPSLAKYNVTEIWPGDYYKPLVAKYFGLTDPAAIQQKADEYFIKYKITNMYHITGSVRLGKAIDVKGNVIGAKNLKVCDNSVIPNPNGNPTTAMMAVCAEIAHGMDV